MPLGIQRLSTSPMCFPVWYVDSRVFVVVQFYPWFKFSFPCFILNFIHYHTQKQREIKFKPRIKLNHTIYKTLFESLTEKQKDRCEGRSWYTGKQRQFVEYKTLEMSSTKENNLPNWTKTVLSLIPKTSHWTFSEPQ